MDGCTLDRSIREIDRTLLITLGAHPIILPDYSLPDFVESASYRYSICRIASSHAGTLKMSVK